MRFRTVASGNALVLSDLQRFAGKRARVIVLEDDPPDTTAVERGALRPKRRSGTMAGPIQVADDFDAPLRLTGGGGAADRWT